MKISKSVLSIFVLPVLVMGILTGCQSLSESSEQETQQALADFKKIKIGGGGMLYLNNKQGDLTFGYDSIYVKDIGVAYSKRSIGLSVAEKKQVNGLLQDVLSNQIKGLGQLVASEPSACTASENIYLEDLELYKSNVSGSQTTIVKSLGAVTVVVEYRDSITGDLLFMYKERRGLGGGSRNSNSADLVRLSKTIESMFHDMASNITLAMPSGSSDARASFGCEGKVGEQLRRFVERTQK